MSAFPPQPAIQPPLHACFVNLPAKDETYFYNEYPSETEKSVVFRDDSRHRDKKLKIDQRVVLPGTIVYRKDAGIVVVGVVNDEYTLPCEAMAVQVSGIADCIKSDTIKWGAVGAPLGDDDGGAARRVILSPGSAAAPSASKKKPGKLAPMPMTTTPKPETTEKLEPKGDSAWPGARTLAVLGIASAAAAAVTYGYATTTSEERKRFMDKIKLELGPHFPTAYVRRIGNKMGGIFNSVTGNKNAMMKRLTDIAESVAKNAEAEKKNIDRLSAQMGRFKAQSQQNAVLASEQLNEMLYTQNMFYTIGQSEFSRITDQLAEISGENAVLQQTADNASSTIADMEGKIVTIVGQMQQKTDQMHDILIKTHKNVDVGEAIERLRDDMVTRDEMEFAKRKKDISVLIGELRGLKRVAARGGDSILTAITKGNEEAAKLNAEREEIITHNHENYRRLAETHLNRVIRAVEQQVDMISLVSPSHEHLRQRWLKTCEEKVDVAVAGLSPTTKHVAALVAAERKRLMGEHNGLIPLVPSPELIAMVQEPVPQANPAATRTKIKMQPNPHASDASDDSDGSRPGTPPQKAVLRMQDNTRLPQKPPKSYDGLKFDHNPY